jgi:isoleucyl-tRNA synthetase
MKFKELNGNLNYDQLERDILELWQKQDIFKKTLQKSADNPPFVFYEGPPTANGKPGIHHVISRTIKDLVCRYKTMTGHHVKRKAGWDTHGLPVEIAVEKQLGISEKEGILEYGVSEFNEKCKESVFTYKEEWDRLTERIGYWLDLDDPYITFKNEYIETLWWILDQFWKKDLIYKGFKILPYCPRCQTPLSSHEVSQGYKDVKDPSIYVKLKLKDAENTYFLVWTTTPWTLVSNVALAVGNDITYVQVKNQENELILAESRLTVLEGDYEIVRKMTGKELVGLSYEPLLDMLDTNDKKAYYVVAADFVSTEDGSGIVHMAPAFGEDDYRMGVEHDLPVLRPVDQSGSYTDEVKPWAGQFVKDADPHIIHHFRETGQLYRKQTIEHSYPHCWRCDTPLIYYARDSWYVKTTKFKDQLIKNSHKINWYPPEVGTGRFGEWLKNNIDWAISRDRFWGTPLNIWQCASDDCGHQTSIGSIAELKEKSIMPLNDADIDLHKHYVDNVKIKCEKCGGEMSRTPEVVDVWFDSGAMPYAQWHYPFANQEIFENAFPADFICEGIDQTRGWFYSLLAISTMLFDQPSYKNVVVNELILDKDGRKMSKRLGNTVNPNELITQFGVDAIRWYMVYLSPPWMTKRFDPDGVAEAQRKFFGTLINTYSFFAMYANIDSFSGKETPVAFAKRPEIDRWILSRLYSVIDKVFLHMEKYEISRATRIINDFVINDVSNWYVRRNRRRFWKAEMGDDKLSAYQTLHEVLLSVSKLIAPYTPFLSEFLYQNLTNGEAEESIHMEAYPRLSEEQREAVNLTLEHKMELTQTIVFLARSLRNDVQIKVRQPLNRIMVYLDNEEDKGAISNMSNIICDELNVKNIEFVDDITALADLSLKPNFKVLGKKAGKLMKSLNLAIREFDQGKLHELQNEGKLDLTIDNTPFTLTLEDVEIVSNPKDDLVVAADGHLNVALDTHMTTELRNEGIAREMVNRLQNLRKDSGLAVTDRIAVTLELPTDMHKAVGDLEDYIKEETLTEAITYGNDHQGEVNAFTIDAHDFRISLAKVN